MWTSIKLNCIHKYSVVSENGYLFIDHLHLIFVSIKPMKCDWKSIVDIAEIHQQIWFYEFFFAHIFHFAIHRQVQLLSCFVVRFDYDMIFLHPKIMHIAMLIMILLNQIVSKIVMCNVCSGQTFTYYYGNTVVDRLSK